MALLLETTLGDLVIDLDVDGSPELVKNVLKLAKARYYTSTLLYNVQPHRFCQWGDPRGDGTGGTCIYGLMDSMKSSGSDGGSSNSGGGSSSRIIDVTKSKMRFLKSTGRLLSAEECSQRGRVVATEMNGIPNTIGSQFLITLEGGEGRALDGYMNHDHQQSTSASSSTNHNTQYLSLGVVTEDENHVLEQIQNAYCDANGRPYADIRIERALVIYDPFPDPPQLSQVMQQRGVDFVQPVVVVAHDGDKDERDNTLAIIKSPLYERPPEERVEIRISANQVQPDDDDDDDEDNDTGERARQQQEEIAKKEDKSRAVVLEMLGDLPSADIKAPENVLFVCKLNPITEDEDLELIFSRFDPNVKVEIIRDFDTGASLCYAFCEFETKQQCTQAYFKMNGALVDDRRIKVDFSQSVAKIWDRYHQRLKPQRLGPNHEAIRGTSGGRGRGGGGVVAAGARGRGRGGRRDGNVDGYGSRHEQNGRRGPSGAGHAREDDRRNYHDASPPMKSPRGDENYDEHYRDDRGGGHHPRHQYPRNEDRDHFREDAGRHSRHGDDNGGEHARQPHRADEYDDFGRKRRPPSPSRDAEHSRDEKRRKHSRKHHRRHRERSRSYDDDDDIRRRYRDSGGARASPRRHDSEDDDHRGIVRGEEKEGGESPDDDRHRRHRDDGYDDGDDERRHRKKHRRHHHHHREHRGDDRKRQNDRHHRDDRRQKKRKHKERRRRSRSRSES